MNLATDVRTKPPSSWLSRHCHWGRCILLLGLALETVFVPTLLYLQGVEMLPGGDGPGYDRLARSLLERGTFSDGGGPSISRSIGYPAFVAIVYAISQRSYFALRAVQTLLLVLGSWGLCKLARDVFDRRTGIVSGVLCVSYLPFVFVANYHLTEALTIFLSVLIMLTLANLMRGGRASPGYALALGLLAGLVAQVRPPFALLPGVFAVAILSPGFRVCWRSRLTTLALITASYAACVAPSAVRNAAITHRFLPFSIGGSGQSLYVSAQQYAGEISYRLTVSEYRAISTDGASRLVEAQRLVEAGGGRPEVDRAVDTALLVNERYIQDAGKIVSALDIRWLPVNMTERFLYFWSTGDTSPWSSPYLHRVVQLQHAVLALLSGAGIWLSRHRLSAQWVFWVFPVYLMVIHTVFHMEPRYSFPARPFLLAYAAVSLVSLWDAAATAKPTQRPHA